MTVDPSEREGEIAARLAAATPGPWFWRAGLMAEGSERTYAGYPQRVLAQNDGLVLVCETFDGNENEAPPHADLIANAPTDLAYLLAEVGRLREQVETLCEVYESRHDLDGGTWGATIDIAVSLARTALAPSPIEGP